MESSSSVNLLFTPTKIVEASLTLSNQTVGSLSTYSFVVNNTNAVSAGSSLHIYFPSGFDVTGLTCTFDGAAATFTIVNTTYLNIEIPSNIAQYALAGRTFEVNGVTNLPSLRPSPSFALELQASGLVLESLNNGVYARLTTLSHFSTLTVTPSTFVAG